MAKPRKLSGKKKAKVFQSREAIAAALRLAFGGTPSAIPNLVIPPSLKEKAIEQPRPSHRT